MCFTYPYLNTSELGRNGGASFAGKLSNLSKARASSRLTALSPALSNCQLLGSSPVFSYIQHCQQAIQFVQRSDMSLFGDDDAETPTRSTQSSTLFGEEPKQTKTTSSSLFADDFDDSTNGSSPWSMPTPKKAARGNLVKNLLPASAVPESYIDAFDRLLDAGDRAGSGVSVNGVKKLMQSGGLGHDQQGTILDVVTAGQDVASEGRGLGRNEFNVLMALVGLAQEGEELTLDGVDERRRSMLSLSD